MAEDTAQDIGGIGSVAARGTVRGTVVAAARLAAPDTESAPIVMAFARTACVAFYILCGKKQHNIHSSNGKV